MAQFYIPPSKTFFKFCNICKKRFKPTGKRATMCEKCKKKRRKEMVSRLRAKRLIIIK